MNKRPFKVGEEIDFNGANKLKNFYFAKAGRETYGDGGDYTSYEQLKRKYKKGIKLKIIALP